MQERSRLRRKRWKLFWAGCFLVALAGAGIGGRWAGDRAKAISFLEQPSLQHVSFQERWAQFRQKAGISDEARVEEFRLMYDRQQHALSIRMRLLDEAGGQTYRYFVNQCYRCSAEPEKGQGIVRKSREAARLPAGQLVAAERFFQMLDVSMEAQTISRKDFAYYLIASDGGQEAIALPGTYYRVNGNGLERLTFAGSPQAEGFHLEIRGSETPGPFASSEQDVHFVFK